MSTEINQMCPKSPNDPSSPTPGQKPSDLTETQSRRSVQRMVRHLLRRNIQKTKSLPNLPLQVLATVLGAATHSFSSLSALFLHLEARPKTLDELDKRSDHFLKPVLLHWQTNARPDISWRETLDFAAQVHTQGVVT